MRVVAWFGTLLVLGGCAGSRQLDRNTNYLAGTAWRLRSIDPPGPSVVVIDLPDLYVLEFRDDAALRVRADCNGCDGSYNSGGRALTMLVDCPTMPCSPGSRSVDVLQLLNEASSFTLAGGGKDLFINARAGRTTLALERLD